VNFPTKRGSAFAAALNTQIAINMPRSSFNEVECCVAWLIFIVILLFEGCIAPSPDKAINQ
jgi:hypothetical protein